MKKRNVVCGLCSAAVMLLLPYLAVTLVKGDSGMAICLILFFAVNPFCSVCIGLFAGRNMKTAWFQPLLLSVLFLAGAWLLFDMGDPAFLLYAAIYLVIGTFTMLAAELILRKKR